MKNIKALIVTAAIALFGTTAFAQIPSVEVETLKGGSMNTATLVDGKTPMIISFWATTCKPCIRELDAIYELMPDWLEEVDFRVVAVSTDDNRFIAKARSMVTGRGWDEFTAIFDKNQEFMRAMNVTLTPQVFVVDPKGKIVYSHTGYAPGSESELLKALKAIK